MFAKQKVTLYSANHKNNKTKSGKDKTILRESTPMYLKRWETLKATLTTQSNDLPAKDSFSNSSRIFFAYQFHVDF